MRALFSFAGAHAYFTGNEAQDAGWHLQDQRAIGIDAACNATVLLVANRYAYLRPVERIGVTPRLDKG
jgi:hypothetical protein